MNELNWSWIAIELTAVPMVALVAAYPFWRQKAMIFGNLVGTGLIFGSSFILMLREYTEVDRWTQQCLAAGNPICFPHPTAFTRFAVYAFIGLFEVLALFSYSLRIENRQRSQAYAPEWRR